MPPLAPSFHPSIVGLVSVSRATRASIEVEVLAEGPARSIDVTHE